MDSMTFDSDNLGATEEFLNANYTTMRIANVSESAVHTHITRDVLGEVSFDQLDLRFDMRYRAAPLGRICLCTVGSGAIEENYVDGTTDFFLPGDVGLLTPPDLPYSGVIHRANYTITMFDPALLSRVAADEPHGGGPVRLTGHRPVSPAAGAHLRKAIDHLGTIATDPDLRTKPLIASTASEYLAASVLHALPNTAVLEPSASDRNDAHPDALRRALAYIDSHVRDDITVVDIAAAAYVTVRALQLAFRRHLDTTPTAYLRELRLRGAHEQLRRTMPGEGQTVSSIAWEWGFAHPGRFAGAYRRAYGCSPHTTLTT
ncbi:helix-turn-helix transcriptional regulator [Nocardia puris]|uniref:AraC family transcriptional regulator n=1 Tax=Nocardia puris TaxID=208602 RepID=A0A366DWL7_9NOCA|nr:AraC family transcriptional regulator [Nocardia puris]MBF6209774.1 helix-turn-helix transcriptional regulator [Nocardia puris]MBF6366346.1 helix-turn-helix transcriptional regulator [Nocardia puris]MBF6458315.1 helix-turn-helix transcriptional regulator [Nocardia puris]RBO94490.1 AraC family transcriptional regulator [Nocardia puris]